MAQLIPRLAERREAMTLRVILTAARAAFAERGYAGASMRYIAQTAGVSPQTIYAHYSSKAGLLMGLVDLLDEEAELDKLFDEPPATNDPAAILATLAQGSRQVHQRCGDILAILSSGSAIYPEIAAAQAEGVRRNRVGVDITMRRARAAGGHFVDGAEDIAAAMMTTSIADNLIKDAGWTHEHYEHWLAETLIRILVKADPE